MILITGGLGFIGSHTARARHRTRHSEYIDWLRAGHER
jgi:nucleoside-diphosphate-sugar epimerase